MLFIYRFYYVVCHCPLANGEARKMKNPDHLAGILYVDSFCLFSSHSTTGFPASF
jgi:hypothetical protein